MKIVVILNTGKSYNYIKKTTSVVYNYVHIDKHEFTIAVLLLIIYNFKNGWEKLKQWRAINQTT